MAFNVPEQYRVKKGPYKTDVSDGNNGFFAVPLVNKKAGLHAQCLASCNLGWEHVSISLINISWSGKSHAITRCPTWEEMCRIKELFWDDPEDVVVQYHPPKSEYVSQHQYCLHLWRPIDADGNPIPLPRPSPLQVGINSQVVKTPNPTPNETKPQTHSADQSPAEKS